ncbi:MAG: PKD domain-containing protein, partial [Ferruginibacter sp.]
NAQTLTFLPPPATGTTVAVVLVPYAGYGCLDTLYTELTDTLHYVANAGPNLISCNNHTVQLGVPAKLGWIYQWSPATGLNDPTLSNPLASPDTTTTYILSVRHDGGGCFSTDTVTVKAALLDNSLEVLGSATWCIGSGDSTVLRVRDADSIQWYKNSIAIPGANDSTYRVTQSGSYYAAVFNFAGCILSTVVQDVSITSIPVVGFTVNKNDQCFLNNRFVFTNTSTNVVGAMQYKWIMGDGFTGTGRNISYSYKSAGTYKVVLIVSSSSACADSTTLTVHVFANVLANFSIDPICINLPVLPVNNTIEPGTTTVSYLWDFGNGQTSTLRNPPPQVYTTKGNYVMSLSVSSGQCPLPLNIQKRFVFVDAPRPGINNPSQIAVVNLPLTLQARPFGNNVLWTPATSLDNPASYKPVFIGNKEQQYIVEIRTASGCITIDTQVVKINKSIEIYVPNTFTPNNDSRNDILRPFMIGIKELSYFRIYNRWGQLVFETHELEKGWDGIFKGTPIEVQTVVWMLEAIGVDNKVYKARGTTVLMR